MILDATRRSSSPTILDKVVFVGPSGPYFCFCSPRGSNFSYSTSWTVYCRRLKKKRFASSDTTQKQQAEVCTYGRYSSAAWCHRAGTLNLIQDLDFWFLGQAWFPSPPFCLSYGEPLGGSILGQKPKIAPFAAWKSTKASCKRLQGSAPLIGPFCQALPVSHTGIIFKSHKKPFLAFKRTYPISFRYTISLKSHVAKYLKKIRLFGGGWRECLVSFK